ncbi:11251_t:CDS:2 [Entrophospora sp. SA101]|nr:11251_t:CDS:2 [Entrophospora sp. SA101]
MRGRGITTTVNYFLKPTQLTIIKPVIKNIRQISTTNLQDQDSNANITSPTTSFTTKIEQETTNIKDSKEETSTTGSSNTQQSSSNPPKELNKPKNAFTKRLKIIPSEISTDWSKPLEKLEIPITTRRIYNEELSIFIKISNLPLTAIPRDIHSLTYGIPGYNYEFTDRNYQIYFIKTDHFLPTRTAIVKFRNERLADIFFRYNEKKFRFGNQLELTYILQNEKSRNNTDSFMDFLKKNTVIKYGPTLSLSGRLVLVTGLPKQIKIARLASFFDESNTNKFKLNDLIEITSLIFLLGVKSSSYRYSKYILRFRSIDDAYRAVRKYHNTYFDPINHNDLYKIKAQIVY